MSELEKVLIVEDNRELQRSWARDLEGKVEIIAAYWLEDAQKKFAEHPDVAAIVMDGDFPMENKRPEVRLAGEYLTEKFRETYWGPIIAASGDSCLRIVLMDAGCTCESEKKDVVETLLKILG